MWTLLTFLFGVVTGVALVCAGVWYILSFFFIDPDTPDGKKKEGKMGLPKEPTSETFQLPPVLITKINDESCKSKESCWAINFVLYFLFRELRNSEGIRRWVLRKLSLEFEELLATTVLGKFFSSISIQNIDLGQNFPVLSWIKTSKVELHPVFKNISTLDILVDLDYAGGFQFAIQAETHLRHSAYLSVQFNGVKGQARLQFATEPYAHWSFSFAENPDIDLVVVSQLYGKSFSHITSIIASQLKRSVRKKHTLPMYKIRYKPFFSRVENIIAALVPNSAPRAEMKGNLTVTVIECRGLMATLLDGNVYSILALGDFDWVAAYDDGNGPVFLIRDIAYVKTGRRETSLDFTLGMANECPVVESLTPSSTKSESTAKQHLEFEIGDEILAVDGKKVTSVKQCVKNFKYSTSMKVIWRVRRKHYCTLPPKMKETLETPTNPCPGQLSSLSSSGIVNPSSLTNDSSTSGPVEVSVSLPNVSTASKKEKMELPIINSSDPSPPATSYPTGSITVAPRRHSSTTTQDTSAFGTTDYGLSSNRNGPAVGTTTMSELGGERPNGNGVQNSVHDSSYLVRTADLPCSRDPVFSESFDFKVEESHRFMNLAVWSAKSANSLEPTTSSAIPTPSSPTSSPSKRSKTALANLGSITFNNDRLIGTLSIPVADIIAECSTTGMGYFVKDYYLRSPDGSAVEARDNPITTHSGFEPHMCYGKISVSFLFKSDEDVASKRRDSGVDSVTSNTTGPPIEIAMDALSETNLSPSEEYQSHHFVRTNFRCATVCDYCNKKIWLKEAFACRTCHMKCHKKCNDRCIANTICRGEGFYPSIPNLRSGQIMPEIITTGDDEQIIVHGDDGNISDAGSLSNYSMNSVQQPSTSAVSTSRRRTLGGLIVSAVQNRSVQLSMRRTGSATNLLSPNQGSNTTSKSLPPSPKASPTTSRKASSTSVCGMMNQSSQDINPFEVLSGSSEEDINAAVDHLIQNPNDDLVAMAKETGRDVYSDLSLSERKQKLNHVLNRLQEDIDIMSTKRQELMSQPGVGRMDDIGACDDRVQALALLMLYYCSGLQQVQDLEEMEKDSDEAQLLISLNDDDNNDRDEDEIETE